MRKLISQSSLLLMVSCLASSAIAAEDVKDSGKKNMVTISPINSGIKEILRTSTAMQRYALDLIDEVEQTQVVYGTGPQMIGAIVDPAADFGDTKRDTMAGLVPPSKKWTKYILDQINELIPVLETDINAISLPDNASAEISGDMHDIKDAFTSIKDRFANLQAINASGKLDNLKIGKEALAIYDSLTKINGLSKRISHLTLAN